MQPRLGMASSPPGAVPMVMTPRHFAKRAPIAAYSASRSRRPSRPSVTSSPAKPAIGLAPASTLMPGTMPACPSACAKGTPAFVVCRIVSSNRIAPPMLSPSPGAVTIMSRYCRCISAVCGMPSGANRLLQVDVLSSIASRPRPSARSARAVSVSRCAFMSSRRWRGRRSPALPAGSFSGGRARRSSRRRSCRCPRCPTAAPRTSRSWR